MKGLTMTKSIEDYPELNNWVEGEVDVSCNATGENFFPFFHYEPTSEKLIKMQATIDAQQERISELEKFARVANRFAVGLAPILQSEGYHGLVENCQDLNERVLKLLNKESK